jgi:glucokinase
VVDTWIGVDVGGTKCLGVLIDGDGRVLAEERRATPARLTDLTDAVVATIEQLAARASASGSTIGLGLPGLVDRAGVLRAAPNLPGVVNAPIAAEVAERTGGAVVVDNDNTTACLAEWRVGAGRGSDHLLYVGLGTGIGGAIVMDGAVRRGAHRFAGELGHMVIRAEGAECICGQRGCWEMSASAQALGRLAVDAGWSTGSEVLTAASQDPAARAVVERFATEVAIGLVSLVNLCDPELIVIGGGLAGAGTALTDPIGAALARLLYGADHRPLPRIRVAALGERSAAIGAALLAGAVGGGGPQDAGGSR